MNHLELSCLGIVALYVLLRARRDPSPGAFVAGMARLALAGLAAEHTVIALYDYYAYSREAWTVFLGHVPLMIALIWPVVIHSAWDVARELTRDSRGAVALTALIVLGDAWVIEPIAVHLGLWAWRAPGPFFVPPIGVWGWGCFAIGAATMLAIGQGRRALYVNALTVVAFTHLALVASWWLCLRWVTVPSDAHLYVAAAWLTSAASIVWIVRTRARARLDPGWLLLRVPGAAFFVVMLAMHGARPELWAHFAASAALYLAWTRFEGLGLAFFSAPRRGPSTTSS